MSVDIFEFWSQIESKDIRRSKKYHPKDREVLRRMDDHLFDLECLPLCFAGPLKTAPVVLLYLSPGLDEDDRREAKTSVGRKRYMERLAGEQLLPGPKEHKAGWKWWKSRTSCFDENWESLRAKVAILNIGAYHSTTFGDRPLLAALPSSRVSIDWAQSVLFPQAMAGERVVVCLRSPQFWGLYPGKRYGKALYAPLVTRGGHMLKDQRKDEIIQKVRAAIKRG